MKKRNIKFLLALFISMLGSEASSHDIAVANGDGITIYYNFIKNKTALEVTSDGSNDYRGNIIIPDSVQYKGKTYPVTGIGSSAFEYCWFLASITIPKTVTSIGDCSFHHCDGLKSITIHEGITSIGEWAFSLCQGVTDIYYNATNCTMLSESRPPFAGDCAPNTILHIGEKVKNIPNFAFQQLESLTNVTIPNTVTSIGRSAFRSCTSLENVTIPNSVTSIGTMAFSGSGLTSVTIPNSVTSIGKWTFWGCRCLTKVTIPNSVTSIGEEAFADCTSLGTVTIESGVLSVASNAFYGNKPKKVIWLTNTSSEECKYVAGEVNYVTKSLGLSNEMIYPHLSSMFEVGGIKYVPVSMSERTCDAIDCTYDPTIDDIEIGETVEYKGVPMNVNEIKPYTLCNNNYVKKATIGCSGGVPGYMFSNCSKLENIDILNTVTTIGDFAFDNCSSLKEITIPQSVTKLGFAFNGCTSLKDVYIADRNTVLTLGSNGSSSLFSSCPLDSVYIGGIISYNAGSSYGYSPFYGNTSLRTVVITDKDTEISANEFYGCTNLQSFTVGDGLISFGDRAFYGCTSLKSLLFGSQVQSIGQEAFSDCTSITEITSLAATPPACGLNALDDINKWECTLHVPEGYKAAYLAADQWKDFLFMNEDSGSGETPHVDPNALVISEAGIATYCPTVDVDFTTLTDVEAYIASGFNRKTGALTMTRVYDVPAGTGLVVKGAAGIHEVPQSPSASIYSNLLRGSTIDRNLSATVGSYVNYVLGSIGDEVGFCLVPAEGMTLAAGRAYLTIPGETAASRSALNLCFDDEEEATGVSDVERQENGVSTVYDLQGRRVEQPRSGLYIRGGKKVIIK